MSLIDDCCRQINSPTSPVGINSRPKAQRIACSSICKQSVLAHLSEYKGGNLNAQDDFEDLFEDEATPLEYMQLLRRGLCKEAARAEAPMPTLPELLAVLKREMARLSTAAAA